MGSSSLGHVAAHALHLFYRAHIWASAKGEVSLEMDRRLVMKALKVSRATAARVITELTGAKLITKHGRRALKKPCRYRLVLPSEASVETVDSNDGLQGTDHTNRANVLTGEPDMVNTWNGRPPCAHPYECGSAGERLHPGSCTPQATASPEPSPQPPPPPQPPEPVDHAHGLQHPTDGCDQEEMVGEVVPFRAALSEVRADIASYEAELGKATEYGCDLPVVQPPSPVALPSR